VWGKKIERIDVSYFDFFKKLKIKKLIHNEIYRCVSNLKSDKEKKITLIIRWFFPAVEIKNVPE